MKTKHYCSKKVTFSIFGPKYYHSIKAKKILFDYLIGRDYDDIYSNISKILTSEDNVFDVGANMGQYLSRLSRFVKEGKIICLEPIPQNVFALHQMKKFLKIENAVIIDNAISDKEGFSKITIPKMNGIPITTQASILESNSISNDEKEILEVRTTTIDKIAEELHLQNLKFIKTDTEGFDAVVLLSGCNTIKQFKPIIRVEENCFKPTMKWLFELRYKAFKFNSNRLIHIQNSDENLHFRGDTFLVPEVQINNMLHIFNT